MKAQYRKQRAPGITEVGPNHFQLFIPLGKDPIDGKHKAHRPYFRGTLSEAKAERIDLLNKARNKQFSTSAWTLSQLVDKYFQHKQGKLKYQTLKSYRYIWDVLEPALGTRPIRSITEYEIDQLLDALQRARGIKPQRINRYRSFLSSVFAQAKQWKFIGVNPVKDVSTREEVPYDVKLPTLEVLGWVLDAHEQYGRHGYKTSAALQVTWLNQLREAEVCGLKVGDFDGMTLKVDCQPVWEDGEWRLEILKNRRGRVITPLDEATILALKYLIDGRTDPDAFILSDDGGTTPWKPARIGKAHERVRSRTCPQCGYYAGPKQALCPDCKVKVGVYFRVQDLRGWMTTYLISRGHAKSAQNRGGWRSETVMYSNYNHLTQESSEAATDAINQMLLGSRRLSTET